MTIQEFTDFFNACKGKSFAGVLVSARRLNADGIKSMAGAFACSATPEAITKAIVAYFLGCHNVLWRGTQVHQDGYPYRVIADTQIPNDPAEAKQTPVPCTTITAYGDRREEEEYRVVLLFGEIDCISNAD